MPQDHSLPSTPSQWRTDPRVLLMDKAANWAISVGGMAVIAAVLAIFIFILATMLPLFRSAKVGEKLALGPFEGHQDLVLAKVDEHQEKLILAFADGKTLFYDVASRSAAPGPRAGLKGQKAVSAAQSDFGDVFAYGLGNGQVWVESAGIETSFVGDDRVKEPYVKDGGLLRLDPRGRPLQRLAVSGDRGSAAIAAQTAPHSGVWAHASFDGQAWSGQSAAFQLEEEHGGLSAIAVHSSGDRVMAGTDKGYLLEFRPDGERLALTQRVQALPGGEAVSALAYTIGEQSVLVGGAKGGIAGLILMEKGETNHYMRIHELAAMPAAITGFTVGTRDRTFVARDEAGNLRGYFLTAERVLFDLALPKGRVVDRLRLAPKGDGLLALDAQGQGILYRVENPHPEVSWRTLFGKVHYEGYEEPEYMWQSTGGSDDFESKFSLTPLVYGTIKGTFYAMLFAVPLAILAAIYVSQFMSRGLKSLVKPAIEIMAALPSVVLGFLAALLLAPLIERHLFSVILGALGLPIFALASLLAWRALPRRYTKRLPEEAEIAVLMAGLLLGCLAVSQVGPGLEVLLFNDFKVWMSNQLGVNYDQRNSLVVGFAMGFAVIPIIFTIAEDSLSSVPKHLTSASLSSGATPWQTALLVVLPVALSGIFSAVMVGFGRAVGETMIVLMATGNTPVMEFNPFNGFRALSANIAVEIPEAPVGGTLYRVLFLAAMLLFLTTFVVNTVAELIRLHLRRKYSQL
jgi:phosphate transport system permease protein